MQVYFVSFRYRKGIHGVICGHHIYEGTYLDSFMGEIHCVQQEADNAEDHFTVAIRVQLKLLTVVHNIIE